MPTWHELPDKDRLAVITYIKTFSTRWKDEKPEPPAVIGDPPKATPELVARGKDLYQKAKCFQCHGDGGKGDGVSAAELKDDFGFPIRPADFTRGQFKGGSSVRDIFRTMTLGLDGAPMPSFADSMSEEERWAISYYVLSLSAFNDPLTGSRSSCPRRASALNSSPVGRRPSAPRARSRPGELAAQTPRPLVRFYKGRSRGGR